MEEEEEINNMRIINENELNDFINLLQDFNDNIYSHILWKDFKKDLINFKINLNNLGKKLYLIQNSFLIKQNNLIEFTYKLHILIKEEKIKKKNKNLKCLYFILEDLLMLLISFPNKIITYTNEILNKSNLNFNSNIIYNKMRLLLNEIFNILWSIHYLIECIQNKDYVKSYLIYSQTK